MPARLQKKPALAVAVLLPVIGLTACSPYEPVASEPGTTPPVWTGSPAPAAGEGEGGAEGQAGTSTESALEVPINTADGTEVATATFEFSAGYATITVETTETGVLTPGFHGLHIHSVGACEAN